MRKTNILVVDPEARTGRLLGAILAERNVLILSAATAAMAVPVFATESIDILFTELALPDRDGISLFVGLQRQYPRLATVVMTDRPSLESSVEALRNGACEYLFKPITPHKILSAWDRVVAFQRRIARAAEVSPRTDSSAEISPGHANPLAAAKTLSTDESPTVTVALEGDLKSMERNLVRQVVLRFDGNKTAAAKALGMHRKSLYRVLERTDEPG